MERLQFAIDKARERRGAAGAAVPPAGSDGGQVTLWTDLPAFRPAARHLAANRIAASAGSPGRTAIDMLRTRLLQRMREEGWRRVMFTSPTPDCGKSTVAANLALALQRQADIRTVVFDLDLRKAALGRILGLKPKEETLRLLQGEIGIAEQMYRVGENLALSVSARAQQGSHEWLKATRTARRIAEIEADLSPDVMIFDAPPFFAHDDAIALARIADCAIVVGAAGQTSVAQFDATERDLAQYTSIAGVIVNKCRFPGGSSGYETSY